MLRPPVEKHVPSATQQRYIPSTLRSHEYLAIAGPILPLEAAYVTREAPSIPHGALWQSFTRIGPEKRIIKGRPFEVGFDLSHQRLQKGAPS